MRIKGELEIDHVRGVIYFHDGKTGWTILRICRLGKMKKGIESIDITHMVGVQVEYKE
jgi:hypothetical protein